MLKIIKATEPMTVDNIVLTLYAAPGMWKTSLAQTCADPLTLDADKGIYRAFNRKASVPIAEWSDVEGLNAEDIAEYSTVVVDTGGRVLDKLKAHLLRVNPKNAGGFGGMSAMGWTNLSKGFSDLVSKVIAAKKDLVIIFHMDEKMNGDDTLERIDAQGSSKNEVYKLSDAMCRIRMDGTDARFLDFDPRQGGFGKNPAQLGKIPVPDLSKNPHFLADVIAQIKGSINKLTEAQAGAVKEAETWKAAVDEASDLKAINTLVKVAVERQHPAPLKDMLHHRATALGMTFDAKKKAYTAPATPPAAVEDTQPVTEGASA